MSALILPFDGKSPSVPADVFIAPTAVVIGDVELGSETNVWYGCVVRGDVHEIRIGARTNIQDCTMVHVTSDVCGTYIGDDVTIGHSAVIHACTLHDGAFIGMKATVLDEAVVEGGALVAAGAVVGPGKRVPAGELWAGVPAKKIRDLSEEEQRELTETPPHYVELARKHAVLKAL